MRRDGATIRYRAGTLLAAAALAAAVWTVIVVLSGGISFGAGGWQIASRDPVRPLIAAIALAALGTAALGLAEARRVASNIAGDRDTMAARAAIVVTALRACPPPERDTFLRQHL